jgi:hypothetical protein
VGVWLIAALAGAVAPLEAAGRDVLALGAAGFAAFLPMRLATAASVSNDTLAEAVFTAGLLLMVRMIREGATWRLAAGLGGVLGLGILTKSSDLLLFPTALVALLFAARAAEDGSAPAPPAGTDAAWFMRSAVVTFGVALLIGGGWMLRNARLYGDPMGTKAFEQYFQDTPTPEIWAQLLGYSRLDVLLRKTLPLTFESFWGVFGYMDRFMGTYPRGVEPPAWATLLADHHYPPPSWVYPLLLIPTAIALAGLGIQVFRSGTREAGDGVQEPSRRESTARARPQTPEHRNTRTPEYLILSLAAFLVFAAHLRFNTEFFQAQGRYLFPAMGPIALGFTCGWLAWWPPPRRHVLAVTLLLGGMLSLALYALCCTVAPAV